MTIELSKEARKVLTRVREAQGARMSWAGALLGAAIGLSACSEGVPRAVETTQVESPSRNFAATVEVVDNGLGFGQGALYDEIHLGPPQHGSFSHGDKDASVIYYAESTYGVGLPPRIEWVAADQLRVTVDPKSRPGKSIHQALGVSIEYRTVAGERLAR